MFYGAGHTGQCPAFARKFFAKITSDQVKYDRVNSYGKLMEMVK